MNLSVQNENYSICRLGPNDTIPDWVYQSFFYSISKSNEELSIVCESKFVQDVNKVEKDWKLIKVEGPLDFSLTGILASLTQPLAENKISIFALSTFDTDYLLVKNESLQDAQNVLKVCGFIFT